MSAQKSRLELFGDHLVVALVAASALTILHHLNLLNWIDSVMLRLVSGTHIDVATDDPHSRTTMPVVLLIGDEAFENDFGQTSPLDRAKLAQIIRLAADACPSVLAIDLDLSPGPGATSAGAQKALDETLQALATQSPCKGNAERQSPGLVLPTPLPVMTPALVEEKFRWMEKLCRAGARFALSDVVLSQGAVLRFAPGVPTLGVLAAEPASKTGQSADAQREHLPLPCEQVMVGKESATFLRTSDLGVLYAQASAFGAQSQFNARFFVAEGAPEGRNSVRHVIRTAEALPPTLKPDELSGRTVFIGSGYGLADRFMTAFGERPGVIVHAATYHSMLNEVGAMKGWFAFAVEVMLGLGFGYLFHWGWAACDRATTRLHSTRHDRWVGPYLAARGWLVGNFALLLVSVVAVVLIAAAFFFPRSYWVNPGPIVIGVFLKSLLASRASPQAVRSTRMPELPPQAKRADAAAAAAVVLVGAAILVFGSH